MRSSVQTYSVSFAVAFAAILFMHSATFYLFELGSFPAFVAVGVAGFIAFAFTLIAVARKWNRQSATCLLVVLATWIIWIYAPTHSLGIVVRFWLEEERYAASVAEVSSGALPACAATRACEIDPSSPSRIAFSWGGILDNWIGVVYDPSGDIVNIERHQGAFGGDLVGCEQIKGRYYLCSFT
jgi:hypothetical protein